MSNNKTNNKAINVGFFGSCRLQDILRTIGPASNNTNFPINPFMIGKVAGFTHTTKETIQLMNYLDDKYEIPQHYRQLIYRPAFFLDDHKIRTKKLKGGKWRDCSLFLIEITSLKAFQVYDEEYNRNFYLNQNTLDNYFNDFLSDNLKNYLEENKEINEIKPPKYNADLITGYYRFQIQRKSKGQLGKCMKNNNLQEFKPMFERITRNKDEEFEMVDTKDELVPIMKKSFKHFQKHIDIIEKVKFFHLDEEQIKEDLIKIRKILKKPFILVTHFDYQIQKRKEVIELLKKIGKDLKIPVFDPSPYIVSTKDAYHYSSLDLNSISPRLFEMIKKYV